MPRSTLVVLLLISCTPAQVPTVHRDAKLAMVGSLVAMIATGVAGALSRSDLLNHADYVFGPIALAGAATFWITDAAAEREETAAAQRRFDAAFALAREAKHAARENDCAQVQAIEPKVRELDAVVLRRFHHDQVIRQCLPEGSAQ